MSLPSGRFTATYDKPPGRPNLILRERTKTDDDELLAEPFKPRSPRRASSGGLCERILP